MINQRRARSASIYEPWRFRTTTCDAIVVRKTWIGGEGICASELQAFMNSVFTTFQVQKLISSSGYHVNYVDTESL